MRILHCFKVYQPDQNGGIEEAIAVLAGATPADSHVSVLTCRNRGLGSRVSVNGVLVERTTTFAQINSIPISPTYVWRLRQKLPDVDVVAFHAPFPLIDLGLLLGLHDEQALIIHWHADILGRDWLRPLFGPLLRNSVRRADRIIVSHPSVIENSDYLQSAREKCVVVPFGTDNDEWAHVDESDIASIAQLRARYPRLIVSCGRLVSYKGFNVLIAAMQHVDGHLILIGKGPLRRELEDLARKLGVAERVTFAGFVERQQQKQMMHAAKLFVLPSVNPKETFGMVQIEAMSCGLPVVNTNLPTGVPDVARHEREGLTVEPGDEKALTLAINRLLEDRNLASALGAAAQARARTRYSRQTFGASSMLVYSDALNERRERARSKFSSLGNEHASKFYRP